jgi:deazaflavin-dependent oxidoreductase (nitroreductase family)
MTEAPAFTETRRFRTMQRVIGAANPLVKRLLDSRFAGPMANALLLLRFRGRRSGKTFTTPVGYVRDGDRIVMVTSPTYRWWRNVLGGADVEVRVPEGWRHGRAEVLMPDDPRYDEALALQVSRRGPGMARGFGLDVDGEGRIDDAARATATTKVHLVLVTLGPAVRR